ncbi:MAG: tetratricopeptide repeat protein [Thermodesulfobacteriota bacterium]
MQETLNAATRLFESGDLSGAAALCRPLLEAAPDDPSLLKFLGTIASRLGNTAEALECFRKAVAFQPDRALNHYNYATLLMLSGRDEEAIAAFSAGAALAHSIPEIHLNLGNLHAKHGRQPEACQSYRNALLLRPDLLDAWHNLCASLVATGEIDAAQQACNDALRHHPDDPQTLALLAETLQHQQKWGEARDVLEHALSLDPDKPELLYQLGVAIWEQGDSEGCRQALSKIPAGWHYKVEYLLGLSLDKEGLQDEAARHFSRASEMRPDFADAWQQLGNTLYSMKQYHEAVAAFQRAADIQPAALTLNNLGIALKKIRRYDEAVSVLRAAVELAPRSGEMLFNLGTALHILGRREEAISWYRKAVALSPESVPWNYNLGVALTEEDRHDEAIPFLKQAIAIDPKHAEALNALGLSYESIGESRQAVACLRDALAIQPDYAAAHMNLGNSYLSLGDHQNSLRSFEEAIRLEPDFARAWYNKGTCHLQLNQTGEAQYCFRKAIACEPDMVEAHWNLSHALLLEEKLQEGFSEYQWRWKRKAAVILNLNKPYWSGAADNTRLLVHTEQGMGDSIQFIRYLAGIRPRVRELVLVCEEALLPVFSSLPYLDRVVSKKNIHKVLHETDRHVPLLDIPSILGADLRYLPLDIPYLRPDPFLIDRYAGLFEDCRGLLKIGLVWRGNPNHNNDKNRSCGLEMLAPLLTLPGVCFFSLQKQGENPELLDGMTDLGPHLHSFADTGALLSHLDLLISVDTSIVHLAGALGRPVWTMIPFVPDWRWLLEREDSPWYPTMRLFRQDTDRSWEKVILAIRKEAAQFRDSFAGNHS